MVKIGRLSRKASWVILQPFYYTAFLTFITVKHDLLEMIAESSHFISFPAETKLIQTKRRKTKTTELWTLLGKEGSKPQIDYNEQFLIFLCIVFSKAISAGAGLQ